MSGPGVNRLDALKKYTISFGNDLSRTKNRMDVCKEKVKNIVRLHPLRPHVKCAIMYSDTLRDAKWCILSLASKRVTKLDKLNTTLSLWATSHFLTNLASDKRKLLQKQPIYVQIQSNSAGPWKSICYNLISL